jgi:hypothetical protein
MLTRVLPAPVATAQSRRNKSMLPTSLFPTATSLRPISASVGVALCGAFLAMLAAPQAMGQLAHRYSFTANANDSVGGAHGTVVDPAAVTHAFTGGQLDLSANAGNSSNNITEDAYVNLPNGMISAATTAGVNGAIALEYWFTVSENRTWQRLGDFGSSSGGVEDTSNGGGDRDYLSIVASSGRGNIVDMTNHADTGQEPAAGVSGTPVVGTQYHVMAVYNHNDSRAFTPEGSNGTMTFYFNDGVNPQQVRYGAIHPNIDIRTFLNHNNWLGRSQWGDPLFDGLYNEFRIYNTAPSAAYVAASFAAGPDATVAFQPWVQEFNLSFEVDRTTGTFTLKNTGPSINVTQISIGSASGAIDPTKWKSVAGNYDFGNGTFDPDGAWGRTTETPNLLVESEAAGDGGQLGTGGTATSLQLGNPGAWTLSRFEDLVVSVTRQLPDFSTETLGVPVTYLGGLGHAAARSDLNFDGSVTAADWVEFASDHLKTFTGMTLAQAATMGDLNGNLANDYDDFLLFQTDYDAANGVGALVALISAVPEPSSAALVLIAGGAALGMRRRKPSRRAGRVA